MSCRPLSLAVSSFHLAGWLDFRIQWLCAASQAPGTRGLWGPDAERYGVAPPRREVLSQGQDPSHGRVCSPQCPAWCPVCWQVLMKASCRQGRRGEVGGAWSPVKTWKVPRACPQILLPGAAGGGQAHHSGDRVKGAQLSSPMALKSEISAGGWYLCSAFGSRACLDGNSRKGLGCQQWVERVLLAWFEARSCGLDGPMRGSVGSRLKLQVPLDFLQ